MHELFPQKLLTIITLDVLEGRLVDIVRKRGSSGEVSGELDVDTNIRFHVIVPQGRMSAILDDVEHLLHKGSQLAAFVFDVAVPGPEKFETPMIDAMA